MVCIWFTFVSRGKCVDLQSDVMCAVALAQMGFKRCLRFDVLPDLWCDAEKGCETALIKPYKNI